MEPYMGTVHAGSTVMSELINSFDVLLHPSMTEGFGLLIIESQACGIPPIANNCHSQPELIVPGVTGEICETGYKHFSSASGIWYVADTNSLYDKMEALFRADRKKMGEAARKNVLDNYNINTLVKDKWIPYLCDLQKELLPLE
jgi:glycosyltransferase involved in cell wall biosynthesis